MVGHDAPLLRFDATTNDWVLFAPARARRPHAAVRETAAAQPVEPCPFCPGHEQLTPRDVLREPDEPGSAWRVRVAPNKFPALDRAAAFQPRELGRVFRELGGFGVHEVIIESPEHGAALADLPTEQIERVLRVLHARFTSLMEDPRLRAILIFKNQGERAGASLAHPHWQLIATPVVPRLLRLKHSVATEYFDRTGSCLYVVALEDELASDARVLAENDAFVAVLPFASHVPYQVRIQPRAPAASFARLAPSMQRPLSTLLKTVLARLARALDNPDFNLTINTAPLADEDEPYFVWHIDVLPQLGPAGGFELGSGMAINPVLPEDATSVLRATAEPKSELG